MWYATIAQNDRNDPNKQGSSRYADNLNTKTMLIRENHYLWVYVP